VCEDLVIEWLRTSSDMRQDPGGDVVGTRLQLGLDRKFQPKPRAAGLPGLGLKTQGVS
jgi:hypothetical protein